MARRGAMTRQPMQRVSPGIYRNAGGQLVRQAQPQNALRPPMAPQRPMPPRPQTNPTNPAMQEAPQGANQYTSQSGFQEGQQNAMQGALQGAQQIQGPASRSEGMPWYQQAQQWQQSNQPLPNDLMYRYPQPMGQSQMQDFPNAVTGNYQDNNELSGYNPSLMAITNQAADLQNQQYQFQVPQGNQAMVNYSNLMRRKTINGSSSNPLANYTTKLY